MWQKYNRLCKIFGMYYDNTYRSFVLAPTNNYFIEYPIIIEETHMVLFFMPYYDKEYHRFLNKLV